MSNFKLFFLMILSACTFSTDEKKDEGLVHTFYLGTYTDGRSKGIYQYALKKDGTFESLGLKARASNPSFLSFSKDRKYLLAVNEVNQKESGYIQSFVIEQDKLILTDQEPSGGADPCFISTNKEGLVLVANYTGGSAGLFSLNKDGTLDSLKDLQQYVGSGPTERQKGPHAHSAWFSPSDPHKVLVADLGSDKIWVSSIDTTSWEWSITSSISMEAGAGPRHLTFHPKEPWLYVLNELNNTISVVKYMDGQYEIGSSYPTLPADFKKFSKAADIHISADGKFLYASNRGHDSIVIFEVNSSNGRLNYIDFQSTHGQEPRNFALSPDGQYLVVANQNSNNLVSFKRDELTGKLTYVGEIEAPSPVCIAF